ncbi:hypothetical protein ACHAXA_007976 [Cyclostephanos tholiformis]|uniref:Uncharacterized protein n=1 Tax=Cyclostephanos tholiformis TaxID=382380 RepID=A0ABD3R3C8_9STRA
MGDEVEYRAADSVVAGCRRIRATHVVKLPRGTIEGRRRAVEEMRLRDGGIVPERGIVTRLRGDGGYLRSERRPEWDVIHFHLSQVVTPDNDDDGNDVGRNDDANISSTMPIGRSIGRSKRRSLGVGQEVEFYVVDDDDDGSGGGGGGGGGGKGATDRSPR